MTENKLYSAVFEQQFEKDYIPGGSITSLGKLNIEKKTHSAELGNLAPDSFEYLLEQVEPGSPEICREADSTGLDSPGDDGYFPGAEPEDG